jgi:hypothetical protein
MATMRTESDDQFLVDAEQAVQLPLTQQGQMRRGAEGPVSQQQVARG